jgi:NADP-dependent 3-hydroxy acid dehydrogenase YdfG
MSGTIHAPVLVLGAAGIIGTGIVQAALEGGWPVIAVDRDTDGLARLRGRHADADLVILPGSLDSDEDGIALVKSLRGMDRPLAGVIATISGGGVRGRLLDRPSAALSRQLDQDLVPHLAAARQLIPLLAKADRGGSYVLIGGPGGATPWAGYGHRSIAAAAVRMLASVLHEEARAIGVRPQLLAVDVPVCVENARVKPCAHWPTAASIGRRALELISHHGIGARASAIVPFVATEPAQPMRANPSVGDAGNASYVRRLLARALGRAKGDPSRDAHETDIDVGQDTARSPTQMTSRLPAPDRS